VVAWRVSELGFLILAAAVGGLVFAAAAAFEKASLWVPIGARPTWVLADFGACSRQGAGSLSRGEEAGRRGRTALLLRRPVVIDLDDEKYFDKDDLVGDVHRALSTKDLYVYVELAALPAARGVAKRAGQNFLIAQIVKSRVVQRG
jgi:hypothetical protein